MVQQKSKKRIKKSLDINKLRKLLIIGVLAYFTLMSIPALRTSSTKTIPVEKGSVIDSIETQGMILKDEILYTAQSKGNISFFQEDGSRLGKATKIAEISNATYEDYKKEIKEIDIEIESYKTKVSSQQEILKKDIQKNQDEIDEIVKEVQQNLAEQNYEEVKKLKDRLLIVSDKRDAISKDKTFTTEQIETLTKRKSEIVNKMKQSSLIYYSQTSGILSNTLDGLEDKYSSKNVDKYTVADLDEQNINNEIIKNEQEVNIGDPLFKIIEDQTWYLMTKVEDDNLDKMEKGSKVSIIVEGHKNEIEGKIFKLDKSKKSKFIIIEFDKYIHELYKKRYTKLKLIKQVQSGMKVPKKAIVEKDEQKGVYIKDISGVVKFRPVNILIETENITVVEAATEAQALQLYDEVFTEGKKVKEGQIVNYKGGD